MSDINNLAPPKATRVNDDDESQEWNAKRIKNKLEYSTAGAGLAAPREDKEHHEDREAISSSWPILLDEVLVTCIFKFVLGVVGHYRYVAGTNRQFRRLYTDFLQVTCCSSRRRDTQLRRQDVMVCRHIW